MALQIAIDFIDYPLEAKTIKFESKLTAKEACIQIAESENIQSLLKGTEALWILESGSYRPLDDSELLANFTLQFLTDGAQFRVREERPNEVKRVAPTSPSQAPQPVTPQPLQESRTPQSERSQESGLALNEEDLQLSLLEEIFNAEPNQTAAYLDLHIPPIKIPAKEQKEHPYPSGTKSARLAKKNLEKDHPRKSAKIESPRASMHYVLSAPPEKKTKREHKSSAGTTPKGSGTPSPREKKEIEKKSKDSKETEIQLSPKKDKLKDSKETEIQVSPKDKNTKEIEAQPSPKDKKDKKENEARLSPRKEIETPSKDSSPRKDKKRDRDSVKDPKEKDSKEGQSKEGKDKKHEKDVKEPKEKEVQPKEGKDKKHEKDVKDRKEKDQKEKPEDALSPRQQEKQRKKEEKLLAAEKHQRELEEKKNAQEEFERDRKALKQARYALVEAEKSAAQAERLQAEKTSQYEILAEAAKRAIELAEFTKAQLEEANNKAAIEKENVTKLRSELEGLEKQMAKHETDPKSPRDRKSRRLTRKITDMTS